MRILIRNGRLIDPSCRIDAHLNLLIADGKIARILPSAINPDSDLQIDASGQVVSPGFIDMHMHEDPVREDSQISQCIFPAMLRMGVTTVVAGNCGDNLCDPVHYLHMVDEQGTAVNVCMLAGHTWFRNQIGLTDKYARASDTQISLIREQVAGALKEGCIGVSFGLRYVPGMTAEEFLAVASCAAPEPFHQSRRLVAAHVRDDAAYVFSAVEEVLEAGRRFRVPLEISHIGSMAGYGQMQQLLDQIDAARADGLDVTADCYPYEAFSTNIGSSTYDDGWRERYHCDYHAVELCEGKYKGKRCTREIFEEVRRDDPEALTICHVMRPEEIDLAYRHPNIMLGSDGILDNGQGHPRAAGAFPRFLARYVREGNLSLYEGLSRMTHLPASRLCLPRKGNLRKGSDADIVIFDPESIRDCSTFEEPLLPPAGINYVLVNGKPAVWNGRMVNDRLGKAIYA